jgi:hypothetical protein
MQPQREGYYTAMRISYEMAINQMLNKKRVSQVTC